VQRAVKHSNIELVHNVKHKLLVIAFPETE
jgi:hypothetical protein